METSHDDDHVGGTPPAKSTKGKAKKAPANPALAFTHCRTLGHAWGRTAEHDWEPEFGFPIVFLCANCGTRRYESWSRVTGDLLMRKYAHPLGFRMTKEEKLTRPVWRTIYLSREGL